MVDDPASESRGTRSHGTESGHRSGGGERSRSERWKDETTRRRVLYLLVAAVVSSVAVALGFGDGYGKEMYGGGEFGH